jgi:hypothetical protein
VCDLRVSNPGFSWGADHGTARRGTDSFFLRPHALKPSVGVSPIAVVATMAIRPRTPRLLSVEKGRPGSDPVFRQGF